MTNMTLAVSIHAVALSDGLLRALRRTRLFHWREMRRLEGFRGDAESIRRARVEHLGHVQALNEFFPMGETAERDDVSGEYDD